jgi:hypothetical protein
MNRGRPSRSAALARLGEALFDELWLVTQGSDRGSLDTPWLKRNTLDMFRHAHPNDRALYWPELKEAWVAGDRARLAALHLKLIGTYIGRDAMDESLNSADGRRAFGQSRAKVKADDFAEAWNHPRLTGLCTRERAKRLHDDGYGEAESIERRVRNMRKRGRYMHRARSRSRKK